MSSILNDLDDDSGRVNYISGGFDDEQKKVRRVSLKQQIFKLVNLLTFHNVITNTAYMILLLCEFTQFLGFIFYKLLLASSTSSTFAPTSLPGLSTGNATSPVNIMNDPNVQQLAYISYFNMKQVLMDVRSSVQNPSSGMTASYVLAGLALFIIALNIVLVAFLCRYAKDGYDALFSSQLTKMMLKACGVVQMVFLKILFLPLLMILISIIICTKSDTITSSGTVSNSQYLSYYYGGYQCWTISHIILSIICIFFALVLTALCAIVSLLFNDVRFHSELPWGTASTKAELLKTIIKILIAIALNIEMYDRWALLVCQCANVILVYLLLHSRWKYFYHTDRKVMIVTLVQEGLYLWLSFVVTLINAAQLTTLSYSLFSYLIISASAFALLLLTAFLNSKDSHYMLLKMPLLKHDYEFEQFFLRLQKHVSDSKVANIDKIVVYGLLKDHQRNSQTRCTDPKCHCEQLFYLMSKNKLEAHLSQLHEMALERQHLLHRNDPKYNFDKVEPVKHDLNSKQIKKYDYKFRRLFFKFFYSILSKRIESQFPKSMRLKFLQVQILQNELSNEFKSYFQVLKLLRDKPQLEYQYFLYQSKQSVEHIMYRKYQSLLSNKQTIDVVKVYDFEQLFILFERQIVNTANNCLNFWKELMDKRLDVNRIHDFGVQISNSYQEVNDIAQKLTDLFSHHVVFQRIYANFLGDVMNNENEAYEINSKVRAFLESANNMHKLNYMNEDKFFGYNTGTVIITITVTPRDIGNIVNANFETKRLLGYRHKELKGRNVRTLMPKILQDNHDSFLQAYFETAKAKILEQQRVVLAKDKDGYAIPGYILVKAIPNLKRNLTFVGFIRKLDDQHVFMQPPTQYASLDYHIIVTDHEGQIYGFTRNCWETFGFKPAFFFNQFGDPEQQIRMEFIIKSIKDPVFMARPDLKNEGASCILDTGVVMENAPKELLNKEEQDIMRTISGQYQINLQLEEMNFANGRIQLKIYKIVKLHRIIRSQNQFDSTTQGNVMSNSINGPILSLDSQELESVVGNESSIDKKKQTGKGKKFVGKRLNSDMFDDAAANIDDHLNHDDIQLSADGNEQKQYSLFESSDNNSSGSGNHSQSQQLINFKKQISTREMPQSIIKLNRLVQGIVLLIFAVVIFDTAQNFQYYKYTQSCQQILQNLFNKHYLISKISSNIITMGLINMGLQNNYYDTFMNRSSDLRDKLLADIQSLSDLEDSIQNSPGNTAFGIYSLQTSGTNSFQSNPPLQITQLNQDASLLFDNSQTMRYAVSQLVSKVGSLLQEPQSYTTIKLPPELSPLYQKYQSRLPNFNTPKTRNEIEKQIFFIVYNTLQDLTSVTINQLQSFNYVAFQQSQDLNNLLLVSCFVFFCVFTVLSGFVIFPIVMGVQKNKVMILSIYFDLPMNEIKAVHQRCYDFLCRIDDERRNEALLMAQSSEKDEHQFVEESKADGTALEDQAVDDDDKEDNDKSKRVIDSSRMTDRYLVDKRSFKFQKKGRRKQKAKDKTVPQKGGMVMTTFNSSNKKVSDDYNTDLNREESINSKDGKHHEGEEEEKEEDDGSLDHNKMLKEIKISNNKLNLITLSVILIFLAYFSTCFGVSISYLNQISNQVSTNTQLYSESPTLQYSYLYFLKDILLDNSTNSDLTDPERYNITVTQVYELLGERESAKRKGNSWLQQADNATFCSAISQYLIEPFEQQQCPVILDGQFIYGYQSNVYSFMYQFQQLRVQYELFMKNSTLGAVYNKINILNNPSFQKFSVISNSFYQAQMIGLNEAMTSTLATFYSNTILFVELRIIFFIVFTFLIFSFLWRIFLNNIQAEVFRSKGMLNMIPTAFLEKDNNMRKLSLNKLVNLG